jgi:hypothetical protein
MRMLCCQREAVTCYQSGIPHGNKRQCSAPLATLPDHSRSTQHTGSSTSLSSSGIGQNLLRDAGESILPAVCRAILRCVHAGLYKCMPKNQRLDNPWPKQSLYPDKLSGLLWHCSCLVKKRLPLDQSAHMSSALKPLCPGVALSDLRHLGK